MTRRSSEFISINSVKSLCKICVDYIHVTVQMKGIVDVGCKDKVTP